MPLRHPASHPARRHGSFPGRPGDQRARRQSGANARGSLAPVYGLAGSLPLRGVVNDLLARYVDLLYRT
jgi:hypothetical protein